MTRRWIRTLAAAAAGVLLMMGSPFHAARAQIAANESWRTLHTPHFRIHFSRGLELYARRAGDDAERAYKNLAAELTPPRGIVDIVLTDAVDASNGAATVFPRNHITVQLRPPVDVATLESYDDWLFMVLQHELTHIFHLDRTRGIWSVAQKVFGRNPLLFPNVYSPAWLTEGLAVYYESRFTTGGRLHGTYQSAVARAAARQHEIPTLDALSLATTRYPGGLGVYSYGSFLVQSLADRHGAQSVPRFVERSSNQLIPFFLDHTARRSFGESFTEAWHRWRDSVTRATTAGIPPSATWTEIPGGGRALVFPRWLNDSTILYVADNGRETPAMYTATRSGEIDRLARRTSLDANAVGRDGRIVFAQLDYVDRFHVRSDLYLTRNGETQRLTHNKRLSAPDVRPDGQIIAVQTVPGSTRLARVEAYGRWVVPITRATADTQWSWPRWSPDGTRIAAVRSVRGRNTLVVIDTTGAVQRELLSVNSVVRALAWGGDGKGVYFLSDHSGSSQLYYGAIDDGRVLLAQRGDASVDLYALDVRGGSADSAPRVATSFLQADGAHLATWFPQYTPTPIVKPAVPGDLVTPKSTAYDSARVTPYRPWRSLLPAYWSPVFDATGSNGYLAGALTSGSDIVGRHSYFAQALGNVRNHRVDALATYRYSRFSRAFIDVSAEQTWLYTTILAGPVAVGSLDRRTRLYSVRATFARPRSATYSAFILGAERETHDYLVTPDTLLPLLPEFYARSHHYPTLLTGVQFTNAQLPALAISPEDGVALSATVRQRWESGAGGSRSINAVGVSTAYKSLNLPGYAHHVLALRLAGGVADGRSPTRFSVGGISGGALEVLPGFTIGDQARTFPVRGFVSSTQQGVRAMAASVEYRAPLFQVTRGVGLFPVFVDRASVSFFGDAGRAYCSGTGAPACTAENFGTKTIASAGAELNLDTALQYDFGYRFRLGIARPVRGGSATAQTTPTGYITVGVSF